MDYHLPLLANADAFRTHTRHLLQRQMHNTPFARRHRVQSKRLLGCLHPLCSNLSRHAQLFKSQRPVTAAIDVNLFVVLRLQPQSAKRQVLQRLQNLRAALQQNLFVAAVHVRKNFRVATPRLGHAHLHLQLKSRCSYGLFQELAQSLDRRLPIKLSVLNKFLSHGRLKLQTEPHENSGPDLLYPSFFERLTSSCFFRFSRASGSPPSLAKDACGSATTAAKSRPSYW